MKKFVALLLIAILTFSMTACSEPSGPSAGEQDQSTASPPSPSTSDDEGTPADPAEEDKIIIGYAALDDSQEHLIPVRENIKEVAAQYPNVEVICVDNAGDGATAVSNVDNLLLQGIDVLAEFNLDASVNPVIAEKCKEAGVPVMAIDIPVGDAPFMGANNREAGLMCGYALGDLANEEWGGKVDLILILNTPEGGDVVMTRMNAVVEGIKEKIPSLDTTDLVVEVDYKDDAILAQQLTADVLNSHPDARHILIGSINDIGAQGAFAAIEAAKREEHCFIVNHGVSVQTRENIYKQINEGKLNCWRGGVSYFLERYGEYIVPGCIKLAKGEKIDPEELLMDHVFIDTTNIEEWYPQEVWSQAN